MYFEIWQPCSSSRILVLIYFWGAWQHFVSQPDLPPLSLPTVWHSAFCLTLLFSRQENELVRHTTQQSTKKQQVKSHTFLPSTSLNLCKVQYVKSPGSREHSALKAYVWRVTQSPLAQARWLAVAIESLLELATLNPFSSWGFQAWSKGSWNRAISKLPLLDGLLRNPVETITCQQQIGSSQRHQMYHIRWLQPKAWKLAVSAHLDLYFGRKV